MKIYPNTILPNVMRVPTAMRSLAAREFKDFLTIGQFYHKRD
jgi:hypothetical protein